MAIQGPVGKENLDISFRLQSKSIIFDGSNNALTNSRCDIVASSSPFGIVFVGSSKPELFVLCLKDLENPTAKEQFPPVRKIPLSSPTTQIATNCDGSLLAVSVKLGGIPHIQIFPSASFLTPNILKIREFRVSADNADALQICWNPVMSSMLAICTESGGLNTYNLKDAGIEFHYIDANLKAQCCCWSPKGKQLVAGFANGRLMQFTPEMKAAKTIECPPGIMNGRFDTIAIQWLSTFQFAVAFAGNEVDARPVLHIVNAPKAAPPQYIAYNDVCYSSTEQRPSRIYLRHILPWNILLVASANSIDVSFLRISQPGDLPQWIQEFPNDMFPAELPLTPSKDESFPLGFEIDIGSTVQLLQEDGNPYPVMPLVHIISTAGVLCSFYILNTLPGTPGICSPARPIDPASLSLFKQEQSQDAVKTPPKSFIPPMGQSTPASKPAQQQQVPALAPISMPQQAPNVQPVQQKPLGFGMPPPAQPQPQVPATVPTFLQPKSQPQVAPSAKPPQALITVPPTFTPSAKQPDSSSAVASLVEKTVTTAEDEQVYSRMIQDEIKAFELEMKTVMDRSRSLKVNIGTKDESAAMRKGLEELDELKKEAVETVDSLRSDVQSSRLGLTEMFSMVYEAKSKMTEKTSFMNQNQVQDRATRRTLDRILKQIAQCEMQLQSAVQVMNAQWSNYQEAIHKTRKNRMHNPSLEGLYQTLTKQQEIIYRQNEKMALLKTKLGLKDQTSRQNVKLTPAIESFSDTMMSVSLADQVQNENSKLTNKKLKNLRNLLSGREVVKIKPQRPERAGLDSEIIQQKKLQAMRTLKKPEQVKAPAPTPTLSFGQSSAVAPQPAAEIPKPAPKLASTEPKAFEFTSAVKPSFGGSLPSTVSFGAPSDSSKAPTTKKTDEPTKPAGLFGSSTGFGSDASKNSGPGISFGAAAPPISTSFGSSAAPAFGGSSTSAPFGGSQAPNLSFGTKSTFGATSAFGSSTPAAAPGSFGLNLSATTQPSFNFTSKPVAVTADKKSEEVVAPAPIAFQPKSVKPAEAAKIPPASVEVSATISLPASKVSTAPQKDASKVAEKKSDDFKTEPTSFTFKIPEKSSDSGVVTIKAPGGAPNLTALLADNSKGFAFGKQAATTAPATSGTTTSVFGGSSSAPFSGFGSGFSLNLGGEAEKPAPSSFSFSLPASGDTTKTTSSSIFSGGDSKPASSVFGGVTSTAAATTTTPPKSLFGSLTSTETPTATSAAPTSTFSFASALSKETQPASSLPVSTSATVSAPSSTATTTTTSAPLTPSPEATLQSLKFCSPDVKPPTTTASSPFGGSSAFGASSFGTAAKTSQPSPSIFGSQAPAATTQASVFSSPTSTTSAPSLFGNLSLTTSGDANKTPASPPTGLFSSLVKPDQSVFAAAASSTSPFGGSGGNVFGAAPAAAPTSPFGSNSGSIFGQGSTQSSIFSQQQPQSPSVFGQSTAPAAPAGGGGLFSQSTFASPGAAPSTNIFGGAQTQAASPFGGSSVFGGGGSSSPFGGTSTFGGGSVFGGAGATSSSSTFGSPSVFGGNSNSGSTFANAFSGGGVGQSGFGGGGGSVFNQAAPAFGANPTFGGSATFGSPKTGIFGQASSAVGQSNSLFEQLGSQQSGGNLFGSSLAQNNMGAAQQQAPQSGGFSGSAFSSWR